MLDASVTVKWFVDEADGDAAVDLLLSARRRGLRCIQPAHWAVEMAAVLARLRPATAADDVRDLRDLAFITVDDRAEVLVRATRMAADLDHHLFDTLYHALALDRQATLVTADERYFRKAQTLGGIARLREFAGA